MLRLFYSEYKLIFNNKDKMIQMILWTNIFKKLKDHYNNLVKQSIKE